MNSTISNLITMCIANQTSSASSLPNDAQNVFGINTTACGHSNSDSSSSVELILTNLTIEQQFDEFFTDLQSRVRSELYVYTCLFVIGAFANLFVLYHLIHDGNNSRVNYFITHLTIADLMVIFVTIIIEIVWRLMIAWPAGDVLCKLVQYARVFGFYLNSSILICISLDRYFAIVHPLSVLNIEDRNKQFLTASYAFAIIACIPQLIVFHVVYHPKFGDLFAQCSTRGFFTSKALESTYAIGSVAGMYFIPLAFIMFCYLSILRKITSSAAEQRHLQGLKVFRSLVLNYFCKLYLFDYACN